MPTDRTHKRRKTTDGQTADSSTSHLPHRNHASSAPSKADTSEPPTTLEGLRRARLNHLATPHEERLRKMKYEYVKTVKVKEPAQPVVPKEGSTASKARSSGKSRTRSTRSHATKVEPSREDDDSQYVYGSPRGRQHVPGAFESPAHSHDSPREKRRSKSRSTKVTGARTERRRTEPVLRRNSTSNDAKSPVSSRPPLRKNTTTISGRSRAAPQRSSAPVISRSEVGTTATASAPARKSGGFFSGMFTSKPPPVERRVPCLTCGDDVLATRTAKLPCTHRMCNSCLKRLFKLSVTDPAHMPPRCCTDQPIELKHVDALFDQAFKKTYNRKFKEFSTKNKIYCPARGCGEWIQPKHIVVDKGRKVGRCPACKTSVCGICSQKMHRTRDCPKDPAIKEFAEAAKKAGWQKCYECSATVELKEGCNHMTCRCTAEFCMMCGLKWKSCDCPWFNYEQIDANGDPVRYQQEIDRRREQERHDEAMARQLEALQLDEGRPALAEWFHLGQAAGRRMDRNLNRDEDDFFGMHLRAAPMMPGGWDDGPRQFEDIPVPLPQPLPRRPHQQHEHDDDPFDPVMVRDQGRPGPAMFGAVPVLRHQVPRRRGTVANVAPEGRPLTGEERDQQRRIRAWATGGPPE